MKSTVNKLCHFQLFKFLENEAFRGVFHFPAGSGVWQPSAAAGACGSGLCWWRPSASSGRTRRRAPRSAQRGAYSSPASGRGARFWRGSGRRGGGAPSTRLLRSAGSSGRRGPSRRTGRPVLKVRVLQLPEKCSLRAARYEICIFVCNCPIF